MVKFFFLFRLFCFLRFYLSENSVAYAKFHALAYKFQLKNNYPILFGQTIQNNKENESKYTHIHTHIIRENGTKKRGDR